MKFPCVVLNLLAFFTGASGASLRVHKPAAVGDISIGVLKVNASLGRDVNNVAPYPRLPPECKKCPKADAYKGSCKAVNSTCQCCMTVFVEKNNKICEGFDKNIQTLHKQASCMQSIRAALDQRDMACDAGYDYKEPIRGITPKRFGDLCNGTQPVGCGPGMCSSLGCNIQLEKEEGEYRINEHYKKVYDEHPCRYKDEQNAAKVRESRKMARDQKRASPGGAHEKAHDESAIAERKAADTKAAKKAAQKNADAAKAAFDKAVAAWREAEREAKRRALVTESAHQKSKAAQAALKKASMENDAAQRVAAKKRAEHKVAAAKAGVAYKKAKGKRKPGDFGPGRDGNWNNRDYMNSLYRRRRSPKL